MSFKNLYLQNKIYFISILSLLISSIFSVGFFHPDEHYQILEFANYKKGNINPTQLPWEFHEKIRPTLQPIFALISIKVLNSIYISSPFTIAFIFRLLSSTLSFYTLYKLYNYLKNEFHSKTILKWFKYFSFLSWFILFIGVRFSSENWSGCILILGILNYISSENKTRKDYLLLGLFFGIAFQLRYQSAFFIVGFVLWLLFINKSTIKSLAYLCISFCIIFIIGVSLDSWFYKTYTLAPYNYFYQNIVLNKASNFGTEPWWYYFKSAFEKGIPPMSILYICATIYFIFKNPRNPFTWAILPFILIHFIIGHKELRFLFPIFYLLPYILIKSTDYFIEKKQMKIDEKSYLQKAMKFMIIMNFIVFSIVIFRPMTTKIYLFTFIYSHYNNSAPMYYTDTNPFETIAFYKRKTLELIKMEGKLENGFSKKYLGSYIITTPEKKHLFKHKTLLYQTYPTWMNVFNIGNWIGKSEQYLIYKI